MAGSSRRLVAGLSSVSRGGGVEVARWAALALGCVSMLQEVRQRAIDQDSAQGVIEALAPVPHSLPVFLTFPLLVGKCDPEASAVDRVRSRMMGSRSEEGVGNVDLRDLKRGAADRCWRGRMRWARFTRAWRWATWPWSRRRAPLSSTIPERSPSSADVSALAQFRRFCRHLWFRKLTHEGAGIVLDHVLARRYAVGAIRNIAVNKKGRCVVAAEQHLWTKEGL